MDTNKMTVDKEQLKSLAEASLTGDWYEAGDLRYEDRKTGDIHGLHHDDDRFIAAAGPATVLALLAEVEQLRDSHEQVCTNYNRVSFASEERGNERDQLKADNEVLRSAAMTAREFIIHEAEVRGLLDENGQVSHRHPRRQAAISKIDAAMAKEVSHD